MIPKDLWTEVLRRQEQADKDRYFAEPDRKRIEQLHRQRQPAPAAKPHEIAADVPAAPAPRESAEP